MDKSDILAAIRQTAEANGGAPLGWRKFVTETGINERDWLGRYWARWSDALIEAGFPPNQMNEGYEDDYLLKFYADYAVELKRLPTSNDLRLKTRTDTVFPSASVFERFGSKVRMIELLKKFCTSKDKYSNVFQMCESYIEQNRKPLAVRRTEESVSSGYVYLYKHGSRQEYKIGKTNNSLRREGEIRIELPERLDPIHSIQTDDPSGIEAYWHRRFADKRLQGEWFALSADDVRAFKRWKKIF
jgi:hypothetical protein